MNGQIDQLVRSLLQKESLEQCSLQELEEFANRHPYFGAAQLLLTKKLQVERSAQYNEQLEKTFLFFHNPLWVQQLLDDTGKAVIISGEASAIINNPEQIPGHSGKREPAPSLQEDTINTPLVFKGDFTAPGMAVSEDEDQPLPTESPIHNDDKDQATSNSSSSNGVNSGETPIKAESTATDIVGKDEEFIPIETESTVTNDLKDTIIEINPADAVPRKEEMLFEPFHTVDYFASQGIRIRDDEPPKDKFGMQLRSFTDWLKSMKKLPLAEITAKTEPIAEHKVEQLAAHSLQEREVVTEAMAEVWEKQGNGPKAIEIYNKLSLLDPPKSAYFAAKIEALKKLN